MKLKSKIGCLLLLILSKKSKSPIALYKLTNKKFSILAILNNQLYKNIKNFNKKFHSRKNQTF